MLIEFKVTNFRSIRETQTLSMVAGSGKELLDRNTFVPKVPGVDRLVRSSGVYGANAAGKTNLLLAGQFLKELVLNSAGYQPGARIPFVPFKLATATRTAPGTFEITFAQNGVLYQYSVTVSAERVFHESLFAYPKNRPQRLFERTFIQKTMGYRWSFSSYLSGKRSVWRDATRSNSLFLSTSVQLNNLQLLPVFEWFQKRLVVIYGPSQMNPILTLKLLEDPKGKESIMPLIRLADSSIDDLISRREQLLPGTVITGDVYVEPSTTPGAFGSLVRVQSMHGAIDSKEQVGLEMSEESNGTRAIFRSAGAWMNVLSNGEVLFFDELDTSLHPLLTRFLVSLFHSSKTNPRDAQLVFNTHDVSLLDSDLFRRDQVWFVEKDKKHGSIVYPLSEFSPRIDEVVGRGYLRGRYGALPIVSNLKH